MIGVYDHDSRQVWTAAAGLMLHTTTRSGPHDFDLERVVAPYGHTLVRAADLCKGLHALAASLFSGQSLLRNNLLFVVEANT
jgi:hypothetical protein